jgi:hypothetical protein
MPDLPTLAASTARLPVQMKFPAGSALNISADQDAKPSNPSTSAVPQVCFFSIPLLTIIATFVLNLFLPVVALLFGVWFLLGLKFCIPPSIRLGAGAGVHAGLDGRIDLAVAGRVEAQINADLALAGNLGADLNLLALGDAQASPAGGGDFVPLPGTPGAVLTAGYENAAVLELRRAMADDRAAEVEAGGPAAAVWVPRVERWEVGA